MRTIKLNDDKSIDISATALTPWIHFNTFSKEINDDLDEISKAFMRAKEDPQNMSLKIPFLTTLRVLYSMAKTADENLKADFESWLKEKERISVPKAAGYILQETAEGFF